MNNTLSEETLNRIVRHPLVIIGATLIILACVLYPLKDWDNGNYPVFIQAIFFGGLALMLVRALLSNLSMRAKLPVLFAIVGFAFMVFVLSNFVAAYRFFTLF